MEIFLGDDFVKKWKKRGGVLAGGEFLGITGGSHQNTTVMFFSANPHYCVFFCGEGEAGGRVVTTRG